MPMTALDDAAVTGPPAAGPATAEPAGHGTPAAGHYLPRPPTRTEKYGYFGARRPYVFAWLLIAAMGILYGYVRVATKAWWTTPALLLLAVMVPPVVVNFWLRIGRPRLTLARHRAIISSYTYGHEAIDVFLPSCGEPVELLDNTMRCASTIRWQGPKTVYVLDDSAREEVRALAE